MSEIQEQMLAFRLHAKTRAYHRRLDRLRCSLDGLEPARCYVSFSAGKDSSVLAHAAHVQHPGIPIRCVDTGVPYHWTEAERSMWSAYAQAQGWDYQIIPWDKWGDDGIRQAQSTGDHARAAHGSMFTDLHTWAEGAGRDHFLVGIRADESKGRRATLSTHGEYYRLANGTVRVAPLGLWSWMDVWAYIVTHDLPWLSIYDYLGPRARNGLIGRNGVEDGRMVWLRKFYPEAYRIARDHLDLDYARDTA